jgi:hypothetical protein
MAEWAKRSINRRAPAQAVAVGGTFSDPRRPGGDLPRRADRGLVGVRVSVMAAPPSYDAGEVLGSPEIQAQLIGAWWFPGLMVILAASNTFVGEGAFEQPGGIVVQSLIDGGPTDNAQTGPRAPGVLQSGGGKLLQVLQMNRHMHAEARARS